MRLVIITNKDGPAAASHMCNLLTRTKTPLLGSYVKDSVSTEKKIKHSDVIFKRMNQDKYILQCKFECRDLKRRGTDLSKCKLETRQYVIQVGKNGGSFSWCVFRD